ncbi:MAG: hypothetical protein Q3979_04585 [Actinomycetaceae bacterium]|nr:hypothetical protein [Actinomycetaceae bacterium]
MRVRKCCTLLAAPLLVLSLAACGGGNGTSKEDFVDGYVKVINKLNDEVDEAYTKKLGGCIYDKINGKVDDGTLPRLAKGDNPKDGISQDDQMAFFEAEKTCMGKVGNPPVSMTPKSETD